ncbi:unnamed protein product [Mytilus edulis]|uniref:IgGFc-binding protein N-terminal domain-containing protein n=1 Tax=Mytilus edulis TaxID=6550 RepID=A0A8S3VGK4_MYTED|nr:unnamed protein product [Mytilus edulis]
MIIATAENTVVKIVIANGTNVVYNSITYTAGMILNITLNMYQTFHVYGGPDYTGTKILSNKPITVISGASCTTIGVGGCDHLSSQMTPVETFEVPLSLSKWQIVIRQYILKLYNLRRIDGSNDLRITDINITKGAHSIYHVNPIVTFLAVSTGLANANGYAYSSGQRLAPINGNCTLTITVPGDIIDNDCDGLIDEELQDGIEIVGDNLSTDMVIAGVLSSLFALSCFSTVVYFLKENLKAKRTG